MYLTGSIDKKLDLYLEPLRLGMPCHGVEVVGIARLRQDEQFFNGDVFTIRCARDLLIQRTIADRGIVAPVSFSFGCFPDRPLSAAMFSDCLMFPSSSRFGPRTDNTP